MQIVVIRYQKNFSRIIISLASPDCLNPPSAEHSMLKDAKAQGRHDVDGTPNRRQVR